VTVLFFDNRSWVNIWDLCYPIWQWHVSWNLRISGRMLIAFSTFHIMINNKYYGELVHKFNFIPCVSEVCNSVFSPGDLTVEWRKPSSGMWRHVEIVLTDVSEERIASIFRVEYKKKSMSEPARARETVWRWKWYVPLKRWLTQFLHGATSQKTAFFIVTAVKTSNLS
jgi:hypothetical protein